MNRKLLHLLGYGLALCASARGAGARPQNALNWDAAFIDRSGVRPVHFVAQYVDGKGATHRLEEWRTGLTHLRRQTDARIDLHADAEGMPKPGQPAEYVWQILDLEKKIDHRVSTLGMMRAGMLYNYYSMAHVLSRPAGEVTVRAVEGVAPVKLTGIHGQWFEINAEGQPSQRVYWVAALGLPLETRIERQGQWQRIFGITAVDSHVEAGVFRVDARGFQVRNVDELSTED